MFGFFFEETFRDEQGEIGVLMACFLEAIIQLILDILPQRVAVGLYDHAAAHGRIIRQVRALDKFVIPLRVIFTAGGESLRRHAISLALLLTMVRISLQRTLAK